MLCNECNKRDLCTSLCPEAEVYVNQDAPNYHRAGEGVHYTPREKQILALLAKGNTKALIRKYLKLSVPALNFHIINLRKKSKDIVL